MHYKYLNITLMIVNTCQLLGEDTPLHGFAKKSERKIRAQLQFLR